MLPWQPEPSMESYPVIGDLSHSDQSMDTPEKQGQKDLKMGLKKDIKMAQKHKKLFAKTMYNILSKVHQITNIFCSINSCFHWHYICML